jgi:hypothetical protein
MLDLDELDQRDGQLDLALGGDLIEYQRSARAALRRVTIKELAYPLNLEPESLYNQFRDWNRRKQPSAFAAFQLLKADEQHRAEVAGQLGFMLTKPPRLTAEEAMRMVQERASSKGFVSADEIGRLLAQTDFTKRSR